MLAYDAGRGQDGTGEMLFVSAKKVNKITFFPGKEARFFLLSLSAFVVSSFAMDQIAHERRIRPSARPSVGRDELETGVEASQLNSAQLSNGNAECVTRARGMHTERERERRIVSLVSAFLLKTRK